MHHRASPCDRGDQPRCGLQRVGQQQRQQAAERASFDQGVARGPGSRHAVVREHRDDAAPDDGHDKRDDVEAGLQAHQRGEVGYADRRQVVDQRGRADKDQQYDEEIVALVAAADQRDADRDRDCDRERRIDQRRYGLERHRGRHAPATHSSTSAASAGPVGVGWPVHTRTAVSRKPAITATT